MIWEKYEKCKSVMDETALISKVGENWDFYLGDQWKSTANRQVNTGGMNLPSLNIIKPTVKFQVSTIAQNSFIPTFNDPMMKYPNEVAALNRLLQKEWRVGKQKARSWEIIKSALVEGDSYQYCGTQDPKDDQVISTTNIFFGDESNPNIQEQPYIMIRERLLVSQIKEMATVPKSELYKISADSDKEFVFGDYQKDIEDKATSILYFEKKDGIVYYARATKDLVYIPLTPVVVKSGNDIVAKMTLYPIASYIPERIPNKCRGRSSVRDMINNQIEINKTIVRRSEAVKIAAYPRVVYNSNTIQNEEDLDKAGVKIAVNGAVDNVKNDIDYINPVSSSMDAQNLQNDLIQTTREINGSTDALTGATDPTRVSGSAVIAMRDMSALPLNEAVDKQKLFVEDLALIWLDQKKVYNPKGMVIDDVEIDGDLLQNLSLEVNIDVSQETPWTKAAEQATVDNLFASKEISLAEYADLSTDGGTVPKGKIKKMLTQREAQQPTEQPQEVTNEL